MINHQMYTENISSDSPSAPVGESHSSSPFQAKVLDAAHALNDAVETSDCSKAAIADAGSGQVEGGGGSWMLITTIPSFIFI